MPLPFCFRVLRSSVNKSSGGLSRLPSLADCSLPLRCEHVMRLPVVAFLCFMFASLHFALFHDAAF